MKELAKKFNTKNILAIIVLTGFLAGSAIAAIQGTLGTTSQGSVTINASKANSVMISGLADITFPGSATTVPAKINQSACIYSTSGTYTIQATSGNPLSTIFRLKNGTANYINYAVSWVNATTAGTAIPLNSGAASLPLTGANTTSTSCASGTNARFEVTIDSATFLAAPAGGYTDTLTLVLAPV